MRLEKTRLGNTTPEKTRLENTRLKKMRLVLTSGFSLALILYLIDMNPVHKFSIKSHPFLIARIFKPYFIKSGN